MIADGTTTMRIAFVVDRFPTLSETFIVAQIAGLIERGHDVHIIAQKHGETQLVHHDVARHHMVQRTLYLSPHQDGPSHRLIRSLQSLLRFGWRSPHAVAHAVCQAWQYRRDSPLRVLSESMACLGEKPFDIIHAHFGPQGLLAMRLRKAGVLQGRLIVAFHGYDITSYVHRHGEDVYNKLFRAADLFLPISELWRRRLVAMGCDADRIIVHRMGIDCSRITFRERSRTGERAQLLTIARLVEKKGVEYAIRAVARLLHEGHPIDYKIVGGGPLYGELYQLIKSLGVEHHVHMLGAKSHTDTVELLKQSHLFLAPSTIAANGDQEGVPVAIMEAMAAGLPVLSTWHAGIPELVQDGETGMLVPERDVEGLTNCLRNMLAHPEWWPKMGHTGRQKVELEFNTSYLDSRLEEIFYSVKAH